MSLRRKHVDQAVGNMAELQRLRDDAGLPQAIPLSRVGLVLGRTGGDRDLALTALTMDPRPEWVIDLLCGKSE